MHRRKFLFTAGSSVATAASCTVGEDFVPPEIEVPGQFLSNQGEQAENRGNVPWWHAYSDPQLNRLAEIGLRQNLDVRRAVARIEQSRALVEAAGYPLSGSQRISEIKESFGGDNDGVTSAFVRSEATWQLDLFGRLKREREAAFYRLESAYADANVARTTLLGELATAYIDARFFQELIRINQRVVESREETLAATQRALSGNASVEPNPAGDNAEASDTQVTELDVAQARTLVASARAELPEARILFFKSVSRVGSLLGQAWDRPREGLDREAPQPQPRFTRLSTGVPADLIRNRPDVRFAEKRLAESVALAGVAEAELYPSFSLTGNIKVDYDGVDILPTTGFGRFNIDFPVFDRPERQARVRLQKARTDELIANWEEKVILAVEEVQDALVSLKNHADSVRFTTDAVSELRNVLQLARAGYVNGRTGFLQVLDAERALLSTENTLALDKRNYAVDYVNLSVALGGTYG